MKETPDSRNLLQRFSCGGEGNFFPVKPKEGYGRPENVELSLGLSLNGRFGLEPQRSLDGRTENTNNSNKKLFRASSVTDFVKFPVDVELSLYSPLTRTCSLTPETEAEWRKRKDLQSLRRSEAKRKRIEKLKNFRVVKGKTREDWEPRNSGYGVELKGMGKKESPPSPSVSPSPSPPAPSQRFPSQGSIGSQGSGGSSGVSELDSQPFSSGSNKDACETFTNGHAEVKKVQCNPTIKANERQASDQMMPCVTTKEEGPDGKKIQGFLYRYGKGEEVRIVCVCHGSFLTPAEFVKHGGGGEVEHPLRHIVVTSLFS